MSKKARSEGNRVAGLIKSNNAKVYTADVEVNDNPDDMLIVMESVRKTLGKMKSAFMLIAGGNKFLIVNAYVPDELKTELSFKINEGRYEGSGSLRFFIEKMYVSLLKEILSRNDDQIEYCINKEDRIVLKAFKDDSSIQCKSSSMIIIGYFCLFAILVIAFRK